MLVVDLVGLYVPSGTEGEHPLDAEFLNARVRYVLRNEAQRLAMYDRLCDDHVARSRQLLNVDAVIEFATQVGVTFSERGFTAADVSANVSDGNIR